MSDTDNMADDLEKIIFEASKLAASRRTVASRAHGRAHGTPAPQHQLADEKAPIVERRSAPRGRPTGALQKTWIDPAEMPFTPVVRPGSPLVSRALSLSATGLFVLLMSWLILPELNYRLSSLGTLVLRTGVLSAQPVQLSPSRPARVLELFVDPSSRLDSILPAGSPIARVEGVSRDGTRLEETIISAPFDARFASIDQLEGGTTFPGQPVATVYDPRRMYVIMTVQPETLDLLRAGMKVQLKTPLLDGTISGTVISAIPLLGTDYNPTTAELVNIRIRPDVEKISLLVPGVRFSARIDLRSAPKDAPPLVFTSNVTTPGSANDSRSTASSVPGAGTVSGAGTVPGAITATTLTITPGTKPDSNNG